MSGKQVRKAKETLAERIKAYEERDKRKNEYNFRKPGSLKSVR